MEKPTPRILYPHSHLNNKFSQSGIWAPHDYEWISVATVTGRIIKGVPNVLKSANMVNIVNFSWRLNLIPTLHIPVGVEGSQNSHFC